MIFNNNTTSLGSSVNVPMAEGYDCSYGAALALVEAAQNDYAMFKSMLNTEARALSIKESASYVNEAEYAVLQEATASGIWGKIKELFSKLIAKIKAIFHTFISKLDGLFKSDKQMVKKYGKEIVRKTNLGNMEVKWSKETSNKIENKNKSDVNVKGLDTFVAAYKNYAEKDTTERVEYYLNEIFNAAGGSGTTDQDSFAKDYHEIFFEDEEKMLLKDTGVSMRSIIDYLDGSKKILDNAKRYVNTFSHDLEKLITDANKKANDVAKIKNIDANSKDFNGNTITPGADDGDSKAKLDTAVKEANGAYEMAVAYQSAVLMETNAYMAAQNFKYKMYKAAFMKAIAANDKKLEESAVFADAFAEAAADEVSAVMDRAITKEELSKICNASTNVIDADVSDDPSKLTYGPDSYTPNRSYVATAGSVDSDINGTSESAYFGQMLY